jgi:hypothetical protein
MNKMSGNYARYMFGNSQTNILTYKLDMRLYYELTHFMDNNSTIKQCVGILDRFLFQSVEINGAKKLMNQYLDKYFLPFFRRMLRNIITLGWCPYHTKKIKDPKTGMPIVVPEVFPVEYIKCQMLVNRETLDYEFQFLNYEGDRIRKDIKVFVFSDMSLIANGALIHSLLSGLLPEQRYSNQIKKFTIQSEYVRSNPPVYLKVDHAAAGQRSTTNQTNGFAGGNQNNQRQVGAQNVPNPANFQQRAVVQVPEMLEKASTDMIKNVEFHQQEVHNLAMMQDNNYYNMGLGFAPQWYNNLFICPPNMTLAANPHLPESRVDQIVIERKLASDIYLSFGIPETLLGLVGGSQNSIRNSTGRSSNIRKDVNIMDVNSFESTLFRYQNFFQDCFVVLFDVIFNKEVDKNIVEFKPPKLYEQFIANVLAENEISVKGKEEKSTTERSKTLGGDADKSPKKEESSGDTSKMKDSNGKKAESEEGNKGSSSSKSSNDKVDTEKVVNKGPKSKDSKDGDKEKESKDDSKAKTKDDNKDKESKDDSKAKTKDDNKDKESKDDSKAKTKDENKDKESKDDSKAKTKDDNKDKESKDDKKEKPKDDSKDKESKDDDKKEKSTDKESKEKDSKSDDESDKESKKRKPEDSDEDDSDSDSEDDKPKRHRKSKRQRKK